MTVKELIDRLQHVNPEAMVRLQTQQNYPMVYRPVGVCTDLDLYDDRIEQAEEEDEIEELEANRPDTEEYVYIVEGAWIGYGDSAAWNFPIY